MSSNFGLPDDMIRKGIRLILLIEMIVRAIMAIVYQIYFQPVAFSAWCLIVPSIGLWLMAMRLPLYLLIFGFGIQNGIFIYIQVIHFGLETGFPLYLIYVSLAAFIYSNINLRLRVIFALGPFFGFVTAIPMLLMLEPSYALSSVQKLTFFTANFSVCSLMSIGIVLFLFRLLEKQHEALGKLADSRRLLISDLSHEIKTPIAAMLTRVQFALGERSLNQSIQTTFEMLERNLRGQARLVNRMLEDASIQTEVSIIQRQSIQLEAFVKDCTTSFESLAQAKKISFEFFDDGKVQAETDVQLLKYILNNLIDNAIHHSPEDGKIVITIEGEPKFESPRISISDSGPGIASESLPRLFDPFFRVSDLELDSERARHGLGLSIAYRAAQKIGAEISVKSKLGQGTRFTVAL